MNLKSFIDKFTINPKFDIVPNFKFVKELQIDVESYKGCFNCDDKLNNTYLKSIAWTKVQYCWKCNFLNVVYQQDRMGGVYYDVIHCYTEKEIPKSRGCCSECGEGFDNDEEWKYNTVCEICGHPIPEHLIIFRT